MIISNLVAIHADLLAVGVATAAIAILGIVIYLDKPASATNIAFAAFAGLTVMWSFSNYAEYQYGTGLMTLWAMRIHLFMSTLHALSFFTFAYVFPKDQIEWPRWYVRALLPVTAATALLTLTPAVFTGVSELTNPGQITHPDRGPGLLLFSILTFGMLIAGSYVLIRKLLARDTENHTSMVLVATGMTLTAICILIFNVLLPVTFRNAEFIPFAALFFLPMIGLISYAISRHHLFNIKVGTAGTLVFVLAIANLGQISLTDDPTAITFGIMTLILVLIAGMQLIRSILKEIHLRETIEQQKKDLDVANAQQVALLHFISHEVKGTLNKAQGIFAGLIDGDYGPLSDGVRDIATQSLQEVRAGIAMVMDVLDASNLKRGTMSFEKKRFDVRVAVEKVIDSAKPLAQKKGLHLEFVIPPAGALEIEGDETKLSRHVFRNLIENAIYYTQRGFVRISLSRIGNVVRFSVEDSGIGITPEDMARLFTEGGRGTDSLKFNVNSTGYGLFIAKSIVNAHRGTIKAESAGAGKGSRFIVELPI